MRLNEINHLKFFVFLNVLLLRAISLRKLRTTHYVLLRRQHIFRMPCAPRIWLTDSKLIESHVFILRQVLHLPLVQVNGNI